MSKRGNPILSCVQGGLIAVVVFSSFSPGCVEKHELPSQMPPQPTRPLTRPATRPASAQAKIEWRARAVPMIQPRAHAGIKHAPPDPKTLTGPASQPNGKKM